MVVVRDYTALLETSYNENAGQGVFLTYSFLTTVPDYYSDYYTSSQLSTFKPFGLTAFAVEALNAWAGASGITIFQVASGHGDINIGLFDLAALGEPSAVGFAYGASVWRPDIAGDVFLSSTDRLTTQTFLHEFGHALGLKHPFEGTITLASDLDNWQQTVMSYTPFGLGSSLGTLDRQAIAYLYGPSTSDGNQVASWSWDSSTETLSQSGSSADDSIYGTAVKDIIAGGAGDDFILGYQGSNTIHGDDGDDYLIGGSGSDVIAGDNQDDTIWGFEGDDILSGGNGNDYIDGDYGDDQIDGGAGNDSIYGGLGLDTLIGGSGADIFVYDTSTDQQDIILDYSWIEGDRVSMDIAAVKLVKSGADVIIENYRQFPTPITTVLKNAAANFVEVEETHSSTISNYLGIFTFDIGNIVEWKEHRETYQGGNILYDYHLYDNGDTFNIHYDNENQFFSRIETYLAASGNSYDSRVSTYYDDNSYNIVKYDTSNSVSLYSDVTYYDSQSRLDMWDQIYDDGHRIVIDYDQAHTSDVTIDLVYYDAQARLDLWDRQFDDGTRQIINYDQANSSTLSSEIIRYNVGGPLVFWDRFFDDGTRISIQYDPGDGASGFSTVALSYDSNNRLKLWDTVYDDGSRLLVDYTTGVQSHWDGQGRLFGYTQSFAGGAKVVVTYDVINATAFSFDLVYYDPQGRLDYWDQNYDNGSRVVIDYDQANASALSSSLVYYDNQSRLDRWDQNYDDGSRVVIDYDAANASNLANELLYFDAQARIDLWDRNYDDGLRILVDFDQDNSQSWNQHVLTYNAQGTLVGDVFI